MTNIKKNTPMYAFAERLQQLDSKFTKPKIKKLLPYWWDDEVADSAGMTQEAIFYMAKFLGLDMQSVFEETQPLRFRAASCRYRKGNHLVEDDLQAATAIIHSLARTAARMVTPDYQPFDEPTAIRQSFLQNGHPYVDFVSLARYCWQRGVPVLYVPELPIKFTKMQAVVVHVEQRYVICLTKKQTYPSYPLFDLAHEMGHIHHQHLTDDALWVDDEVDAGDTETQEGEANQFANLLLTGKRDKRFRFTRLDTKSNDRMLRQANIYARNDSVEPGYTLLNWAHWKNQQEETPFFPLVNNVLKKMYPNPTWQADLKAMFLKYTNYSEVKDDDHYYLLKTLKYDDAAD